MSTYTYKAWNDKGEVVRGSLQAANEEEISLKLKKEGLLLTEIAEFKDSVATASEIYSIKLPSDVLNLFYIQFTNLLQSGLSIIKSLEIMVNQTQNKKLKMVLKQLIHLVEGGQNLSSALTHFPKTFPKLFINIVKAGEASGKLENALARFTVFSNQQQELKKKMQGALIYPCILIISAIGVILFIVSSIIPQFYTIFIKAEITLPYPTQILNFVGVFLTSYWLLLLAGLGAFIIGLILFSKTELGKGYFDYFKLHTPLIGNLYKKMTFTRFSLTIGTLVESGVPILKSLDIVKEVLDNKILAKIITRCRNSVESGEKIADSLKSSAYFPRDLVEMLSVGEESGSIDKTMFKVGELYLIETEFLIKKITTLIEPVLMLFIGSIICFILISLLLPIFDLIGLMSR